MAKSSRKKRNKSTKTINTNLNGSSNAGSNDAVSDSAESNSAVSTASTGQDTTSEKPAPAAKAKKSTTRKGRRPKKKTNYTPWIIGGLVLIGLIAFPQIQRQYKLRTATGEFAQLIRQGSGDVRKLQVRHRDLGRTHVPFGSDITYNSTPPTTGPHYGSWINPGYYVDEQEPKQLVHSLEHGHVVAYYGEGISEEDKDVLIDWTGDFRNQWAGFIAAPFENAGDGVILTAWRHTLQLDKFDPAIAAAFIDRHRGRGPENPVR